MTDRKKILITAGRSPITLELARILHAAGHQVFVAETDRIHLCRFTNSIVKSYVIPSPRFEPNAFVDSLVNIVENEKIDFLLPISEEIICLSKGLDRFPKSCTVFCAPFKTNHTLHSKWQFNCLLESLDILAPKSILITSKEDLKKIHFTTPYVLKPCYSRASQKVKKVDPLTPIPSIEIEPHNPWVAQEWIEGSKFCSYSVCHKGEVKAHSLYPVDYAIEQNSCVAFSSIEHPKILEWVKNFVKAINFTGQIAFDFIQQENGDLYSIECNPRATSGVHLFGIKDQLDLAFFNNNGHMIKPRPGTKRQFAIGMMLYGWQHLPPNKTMKSYFIDLLRIKDVIFQLSDIKPFLSSPFIFLKYLMMSRKMNVAIPLTFTFDLEWNGETSIEPSPESKKQIA